MFSPIHQQDFSLRLFEPEEATELFGLVDRNRTRLREWLPWLGKNLTPNDSATFIAHCQNIFETNGSPTLGIRSEGKLVGIVGFHPLDRANRHAALGYWIGSEGSGRGLVTRATREFMKYGFEVLSLERIELRCATGNHASRQVAERLGFQYEGTLRKAEWLYDYFVDHAVFSMLRAEWKN